MNKESPWIKLFAVMVVGGVAKALFDDRTVVHNHYDRPSDKQENKLEVVES
jgi:hypothetical protein